MRQKQVCCAPECAESYALKVRAKAERINALEARKTIRLAKEKLKTRSDYIKEAQIACNAYVRERDKNKPCISCGCVLDSGGPGGGFDAGHYRSRGSAPHLRFSADSGNINGQCKRCNRHLAGNYANYRANLIHRIGLASVEALESDNEPRKWTVEELKEIAAFYKAKLKAIKSNNQLSNTDI